MVNNFSKVKLFLQFDDPNTYYFLQIIKRRKDNPEMSNHSKIIKDIYIYSLEQFESMKDQIIELCHKNNARAYLRLNKRCTKKTGLQVLKRITELIIDENYKAIPNVYASVSGEFHADKDKKWIVDIDDTDECKDVIKIIYNLQLETGKEPLTECFPTKNGIHILTRPFNLQKFKITYPNIDVHKDNMVILYENTKNRNHKSTKITKYNNCNSYNITELNPENREKVLDIL